MRALSRNDGRPFFVTPLLLSWHDEAVDTLNNYKRTYDELTDKDLLLVYLPNTLDKSNQQKNAEEIRKAIDEGQFRGLRLRDLPCFWIEDQLGGGKYPIRLSRDENDRVPAAAVHNMMTRLIDAARESRSARELWWKLHASELLQVMGKKTWMVSVGILSVLLALGIVTIIWAIRAPTDQFGQIINQIPYYALGGGVLVILGLLVGFLYRLPADKVAAFVSMLILLGLVLWQAQRIREFGLVVVLYFVYLAAALIGAYVLVGMLKGTGSLEGERGGVTYRFGGAAAVALAILGLGLGFEIHQNAPTFDVIFFLFSTDPAGELVERDGQLALLLNERKDVPISKGSAQVILIPSSWKGRRARVSVKVDGYRLADDSREVELQSHATINLNLVPMKPDSALDATPKEGKGAEGPTPTNVPK